MAKRKAKKAKSTGTRRKSPAKPARSTGAATKIKRLDSELVRLLQQRADLVLESARRGGRLVLGPTMPDGEDETLRRLASKSRGPMPARSVGAVLREVAGGCRALIRVPRVAFPGPPFGFGHLAAMQHFGRSAECVPVDGAAAVFDEVHRKQSDLGLVPLDSSTDDRLADVFDALVRNELKICGKVTLCVRHALLSKCPRAEVREVYGTPPTLSQCRNWLAKHLHFARPIEVTSTSTACQLAGGKPGGAAVASREAGVCFNLEVVAEDIEDNAANTARFAVIGDQLPPRTKNDRVAMLFQLEQRPGALADAVAVLKRNKINLTWIESLPIVGPDRVALFFVEIEGHEADKRLCRKLATLRRKTLRLEMLGSYPAAAEMD